MAAKLQLFSELATQSTQRLTNSRQRWTAFLEASARLYKYPFPEQLMIFAQRPDARACAPLETWNKPMNRYIKRGSKGIALIDNSGERPRLRYVFDIADTEDGRRNPRRPFLWELREEHLPPVKEALIKSYDSMEGDLGGMLYDIAKKLAEEFYNDNQRDICYSLEGSFLEDYDEINVEKTFCEALTVSTAYSLMSRCGLNTQNYFEDEDFQCVFDFNTLDTVNALGTAVSELSGQVLREIGATIRTYEMQKLSHIERSNEHGQPDLQSERRLSSPRSDIRSTVERTPGQIRSDAEELSQEPSDNLLQFPVTPGEAISPLAGDQPDSQRTNGIHDERVGEAEPASRQRDRPDGMGATHEQPATPSGGNDPDRTDLRLTRENPFDDQTLTSLLSTSFLSIKDVDAVLRDGGNQKNSTLRIAAKYGKNKPAAENVKFLKMEYRTGGKGFQRGEKQVSVWWDDQGLRIGIGKSALNARDNIHLSWEQVEARIYTLIHNGNYLDRQELSRSLDNEHQELAQRLWYFYRDDLREMPEAWNENGIGFPDSTATIFSLISQPEQLATIADTLEADIALLRQETPPRRLWHDPEQLLMDVRDFQITPLTLPTADSLPAPGMGFITEDEIDAALTGGSGIQHGKFRVFSYFLHEHTPKDAADFLKQEYGTGGRSHALSGADNSYEDYSAKGIKLTRGALTNPYDTVQLKWNAVVKRIDRLINEGRYMTPAELDHIPAYEKEELAREIYSFFYNVPETMDRPYEFGLDYYKAIENLQPLLDDPAQVQEILAMMPPVLDVTEESHRQYTQRQKAYADLTAFQNGTFTLFPHLSAVPLQEAPRSTLRPDTKTPEPEAPYVQLSLFPTVEAQQADIQQQEESEKPAAVIPLFDMDMDNALRSWNGNPESRMRVYDAIQIAPRARETAAFLQREYGGNLPAFPFVKEGTASPIPWPKVQRRIAQLAQAGLFLSSEEQQQYETMLDTGSEAATPQEAAPPMAEITQEDIDFALRESLGSTKDKQSILHQLKINPRSREAVQLVKDQYIGLEQQHFIFPGGEKCTVLASPASLTIIKRNRDGNPHETHLPWPKVHRRIAQLVEAGQFLFPEEQQPLPETMAQPGPPYTVGDTVYLENDRPFVIDQISEDEIILQSKTFKVPKFRTESRDRFEQLLLQNPKNKPFTEYLMLNPDSAHEDLRDVLENGLLTWDAGIALAELFQKGAPNSEITEYLLRHYTNEAETMTLNTGEAADYFIQSGGIAIEVQDRFTSRYYFHWEEVTALLRGIHEREPELFQISEPKKEASLQEPLAPPQNFHITDDHLGEGGAKTKYNANLAAIRMLKQLEAENRTAVPQEQEILSRYVGWGGLPQAFDSENNNWTKEYGELKSLLTDEEYEMARASTLNAHYTSPTIIRGIYETVARLGFQNGNVLEPACGIGNFFGLLPESMKKSKLYGVELDSITGRIAKQLYPQANIQITGFEKTDTPDAFFDIALGNVPFGQYKVYDKRYDKHNFLVHDFFLAKTFDQVRPGGIVAFVTSKGTMDKRSPEVRKYLAQRGELLGAVRLPNNAFLKNAGTEVTSDILFFQKRDHIIDIEPDWVHLGQTEDGIPVNAYFADHPEMVLGTMAWNDRMYGNERETACIPIPGAELSEQLTSAFSHIQGQITDAAIDDIGEPVDDSIPADPAVRNFSYAVVDDKVYFRENSRMYPVNQPITTLERIKGMVALRDCTHELINFQLDEFSDTAIAKKQAELNTLYNRFTAKYGLINSIANSRAFSDDTAYYLLCSLEVLDENGDLERKADMFTKRTIKQRTAVTSVDTASEALAVSIGERACVDMGFMRSLTGFSEEKLIQELNGVIFRDLGEQPPEQIAAAFYDLEKLPFVTADEYLSGNVRQKLRLAKGLAQMRPDLADAIASNIKALEMAQPKDLDASEISVRLGSTWVDKQYIQQFMTELLKPSNYLKNILKVNFFAYTGEWNVEGHRRVSGNDVLANVTYGTDRMNAYQIIEETLNLRDVRIYDTITEDGKEKRVLNKNATTKAQQKQEDIKRAFREWIFKDPERRHDLVKTYNEIFNSSRTREYDGSHINFSGISPDITLRPHQLNAIAHILYGGNTLLAHEVGAGKTFEMVAAAMESKRLGLCNKSLFAVPNHLTEQMASEFLRLYPSANILVATKKDFEMRNRRKFCAKISTGDYDAVIIGHSQLEKIPMSRERQERQLREQIREITNGINDLKQNNGARFSIKQLEKTKRSLESRLDKLTDDSRKDDVVTFEQLGVDRLFVDEAHSFKNLFLYTKMRNVAGISQSEAQKSSDLFMKCRYMDELTAGNSGIGRGVIFATGTPISNSMTEMYTMQRYLQYNTLRRNGLLHFDAWASTFGETVTAIELAPEGTGYRARTRFARFYNLPELMTMFREVADIKTADMLDLPRPKANFQTIVVKPSELQQEMVKELSERAATIHAGNVDPSVDNMLLITSDGRKIGLDQRLINPLLPDDEGSKVNACMNNVYEMWRDTKKDRLTQLVFCDFSTPNSDGRFNVYDDIKRKLIAKGVPANEVAFIHDANTEIRKKELYSKVRKGMVRILFGSTFMVGSGTNVQDRLIMLHDLDCPWRPGDLEQRAGRIVRQGNQNKEVHICRYVTEGTFDAYLYQTVENKQKFISQIMSSKSPVRSCEDVDETTLSYAEIKALCAGNPLIKEKMDLDIEVARLRLLKADHQSQHYRLEDDLLKNFPEAVKRAKGQIAGFKADVARLEEEPKASQDGFPPMVIKGIVHAEKEKAGAALLEACKEIKGTDPVKIGHYRGFDMHLSFDSFYKTFRVALKGAMSYSTELGADLYGNITRINNALGELPQRLTSVEVQLENLYEQTANAKEELKKPFPHDQELKQKEARLALLNVELDMDGKKNAPQQQAEVAKSIHTAIAKSDKPSILDNLSTCRLPENRKPDKPKNTELSM